MGSQVKRRDLYSGYTGVRGTNRTEYKGVSPLPKPPADQTALLSWPGTLRGTQVTVSTSHPTWGRPDNVPSASDVLAYGAVLDDPSDIGGDFTSTKQQVISPVMAFNHHIVSNWIEDAWDFRGQPTRWKREIYDGPLQFDIGTPSFPPFIASSDQTLAAFGTKAIALCAPTNSVMDLAVSLAELYREGIPNMLGSTIWKQRSGSLRDVARDSGGEYLNLQFGWQPLVSDVKDFSKSIMKFDKIVSQYLKDAGKVVRRRYAFPIEWSSTDTVHRSNLSVFGAPLGPYHWDTPTINKGQVIRRRETFVRRWFSGAFTYHLPDNFGGDGLVERVGQAREILGLDLTPEVLWNLAPWSWAADWFGNFGDVIHNADAFGSDGLVMKYGYIMEHSFVRDSYSFSGPTGLVNWYTGRPPVLMMISETKLRRRATPFGFGLTFAGFSNRQKAIVAALGLSRV